ncbi:MAG: peptide deformylase [Spirochaetales bacterium]
MLNLVLHPDETLRAISEPVKNVDGEIAGLAKNMIETMQREQGIGLAGVQVGRLVRLFVTSLPDDKPRVFINPEITDASEEISKYEEGCLSFPGLYADVERSAGCTVEAVDEEGKPFRMDLDGMLARVVLHELDHLNGVLFVDYLPERKRDRLLRRYERLLAKAKA